MRLKFSFKRAIIVLSAVLIYSVLFETVGTVNDFKATVMADAGNGTSENTNNLTDDNDNLYVKLDLWKAQLYDYNLLHRYIEEGGLDVPTDGNTEEPEQTTPPVTTPAPVTTTTPKVTTQFVPQLSEPFNFKRYTKPLNPANNVGAAQNPGPKYSKDDASFTVRIKQNGQVVNGNVYHVLCSLLQQELHSAHKEAMKAQAVSTYSMLKYHDEVLNNPVSVNLRDWSQIQANVQEAVTEVLGRAMYYNGTVVNATYSASTGGASSSASDVWGGNQYPYLKSVPSIYDDKNGSYYSRRAVVSQLKIKNIIQGYFGITLPQDPTKWFEFLPADQGGVLDGNYVGRFRIYTSNGSSITTTGRTLRESVLKDSIIRSAMFDISYYNGNFTFTSYGHGHGVGLSQIGADCYAKYAGYTYDQILRHYFTGVTVS